MIWESVSHNAIPAEDLSRTILAWANDSSEQTKAVIKDFANRKASGLNEVDQGRLEIVWAAQALLEAWKITIPFLPQVAERFPCPSP